MATITRRVSDAQYRKIDAIRHNERLYALLGVEDTLTMQRIARSLHRLSEADCNGYQDWRGNWDEAAEKRAEARTERLVAKAKAIAAAHGIQVYIQDDPRGAPVYLWTQKDLDAYNARNHSPEPRETPAAWGIEAVYNRIGVAVY